jgi:hypothetical protein
VSAPKQPRGFDIASLDELIDERMLKLTDPKRPERRDLPEETAEVPEPASPTEPTPFGSY